MKKHTSKYIHRSLVECESCKQLRSPKEVEHMGDRPTIYICNKCLEIKKEEG